MIVLNRLIAVHKYIIENKPPVIRVPRPPKPTAKQKATQAVIGSVLCSLYVNLFSCIYLQILIALTDILESFGLF